VKTNCTDSPSRHIRSETIWTKHEIPCQKGIHCGRNIVIGEERKCKDTHPEKDACVLLQEPGWLMTIFWIKLIYSYAKHIWYYSTESPRHKVSGPRESMKEFCKYILFTPMLNDKITIDFIDIYQGTWRNMDQGIKKNTLIKIKKSQTIREEYTYVCARVWLWDKRRRKSTIIPKLTKNRYLRTIVLQVPLTKENTK